MTGIREMVIERRRLRVEVERLREAIEAHRDQCHRTNKVELARWDWDLWAVLDA